jgi:hypothetical protein
MHVRIQEMIIVSYAYGITTHYLISILVNVKKHLKSGAFSHYQEKE